MSPNTQSAPTKTKQGCKNVKMHVRADIEHARSRFFSQHSATGEQHTRATTGDACEEIQVYLNVATVTPSPRADAHARPTRGPLPEPHNEPVRPGPTRSAYIARTTAGCTIHSTAVSPDRPPRTQRQCVLVQSRPIDLLRVQGSLLRSPILHRLHAVSALPTGSPSSALTRA